MWFNKYKSIISDDGARPLTDLENLFGGMSAGCFSSLGNNPFDVVKTRMQGMDAAKYKNTVDCFRQVCTGVATCLTCFPVDCAWLGPCFCPLDTSFRAQCSMDYCSLSKNKDLLWTTL